MCDSDVIRRKYILTLLRNWRWLVRICFIVLHMSLNLRHSSTQHALVWIRTSSTGCSLLDVIYHLNLQYLLITDIMVGVGRGGGGVVVTVAVGLSPTFMILKPCELTSFPSSSTFVHLSQVSPYSACSSSKPTGGCTRYIDILYRIYRYFCNHMSVMWMFRCDVALNRYL